MRSAAMTSGATTPLFPRLHIAKCCVGAALAGAVLLLRPAVARAQYIQQYFQPGVPGYGSEAGVTVLSRERPGFEEKGVQVGDFNIRADLDEGFGYNSNVNGIGGGPGSWFLSTAPSISVVSTWPRNALGASITLNNYRYFETPSQNHTDWTASLGGAYTIGRGDLTVGYSHLALHESATGFGALRGSTSVPYTVDDFRSDYTFNLGRISLIPNIEDQIYRYTAVTIPGHTFPQSYRNRNVLLAGITTRYELSPHRDLLLVLQGIDTQYEKAPLIYPPSNSTGLPLTGPKANSTGFLLLAGIDYLENAVLRYRLLAGVEVRSFESSQFGTQVAPIVEGSVIWTPTGLTTVTATLARDIEDPATEDTGSYIYTTASLVVDHELRRNVLLEGRAQYQIAQYLHDGTQTSLSLGGGVTWLLSRRLRLSADYTYTQQRGPLTFATGTPGLVFGGNFTQNLALLTLHVAL